MRDRGKLGLQHENLRLVQGDIQDAAQVEQAIAGQDAVLSVLGQTPTSPKDVMEVGAKHILAAMRQHGVRRLVTLTGAGVEDPKDQPGLLNHVITFLLKTIVPQALADAVRSVKLVRASSLDWTVVRAPRITDGVRTGKYRVGYVGKGTGNRITRADLADFMLKQAQDRRYVHDAPVVSN